MRILYIDIDSLRPDHLGCYGYHRATSPNMDRIAAEGVRFENCYVSDAPCLPSRTAMFGGRFGIHSGVVGHGGTAADPFLEGPSREFSSRLGNSSWMHCLRRAGLKTVTVSSFGERHAAWHWYANFSEVYNPGYRGAEVASQVAPIALDRWTGSSAMGEQTTGSCTSTSGTRTTPTARPWTTASRLRASPSRPG
jgi:arylsulfatase A-like enzyme